MTDIQTIIKAYIEGDTIEYRDKGTDQQWINKRYSGDIAFYPTDFEYRIKPKVVIKYVLAAHFEEALKANNFCASKPYMHAKLSESDSRRIKLTFENGDLIKAEVE